MARTQVRARKKAVETPRLKVINPGKGLNVLTSDNLIDDREASDLQNIQFVEAGGVSKRFGFKQLGDTLSNNPRGLGTYVDTSLSKYAVTIDGTTLKYLKDASTTWASATGSTFTSGQQVTFTQARGTLYVWNGTEGGTTFNGSACSRPGTMPKAKFSIFWKSYHFASGVAGQLNRLYMSEDADASKFTRDSGQSQLNNSTEVPGATVFSGTGNSAQFIDIDKDDGDKITGLATFQDTLIVFKERSIHQVSLDSSDVPSVALVTRGIGCVSHKSIENVENDVFLLSRRGFYVLGNEPNFFNAIRTNELSARVNPRIKLISEANLGLTSAIYYDYKYWVGVPEGGTSVNNLTWTYDRRYLAWSKTKAGTFQVESFTVLIDSNNREKLLFTDSSSAKVYELIQAYNDDNSGIDAYWVSKAFDANEFDITKRWLYVDLQFRAISGSIDISLFTDNDTLAASASLPAPETNGEMGTQLLGEDLLGGLDTEQSHSGTTSGTVNVAKRVPIRKNSRTIKVKIANSTVNQNFVLTGVVFGYIPFTQYRFKSSDKLVLS